MKIILNQLTTPIEASKEEILLIAAEKLKMNMSHIKSIKYIKQAVDARRKQSIHFVYTILVETFDPVNIIGITGAEEFVEKEQENIVQGNKELKGSVFVIGSGPSGLFAALELAKHGYRPIIFERGEDVETRAKKVNAFWNGGALDSESNVQFGEGGAGTFSDGKLTTRINDPLCEKVLKQFVEAGAPAEILYKSKPHIGTDCLMQIVPAIRKEIQRLGGSIHFKSKLTNIKLENGNIKSITINNSEKYEVGALILAIGHSARDTFELLVNQGILLTQKAFSVGVRIEHPQKLIDKAQYGELAGHKALGAADYQLFSKGGERTAYTFCMCPGGKVVSAASQERTIVTNGMSEYNRACENANSAFVVSVGPSDFEGSDPLSGVRFQKQIEEKAFIAAGESYAAPVQLLKDFIQGNNSKTFGIVKPSFTGSTEFVPLEKVLPQVITEKMKSVIREFDNKLHGFSLGDAILTAPETRTSSPVRILRNENGASINAENLYPAGEGAGYAGGIMSAAVDGLKAAAHSVKNYQAK